MGDYTVKMFDNEHDALNTALSWLVAEELIDVVKPRRLVQTVALNSIHNQTKAYLVVMPVREVCEYLAEEVVVIREGKLSKYNELQAKMAKMEADSPFLKDIEQPTAEE